MTAVIVALIIIVAVVAAIAGASVRVLREYERAVVFRLGRLLGQKGPGIVLLIPGIDRMVRVDLRTVTFDVPPQDLITRDNVPAKVNAVTYFRVVDPVKSVSIASMNGPKNRIAAAATRIFGMNVSVGSWICVTAWRIEITRPTIIESSRTGSATTSVTKIASRPSPTTSPKVIACGSSGRAPTRPDSSRRRARRSGS